MTYCNEFVHVYHGNRTICMCGLSSYSLEQARILELEKQLAECQKERDEYINLLSNMTKVAGEAKLERDRYAAALKDLLEVLFIFTDIGGVETLQAKFRLMELGAIRFHAATKALREGGGE